MKKINLILVFMVAFLGIGTAHAQSFEWAKAVGGEYYDQGNAIVADASGNVYIVGAFEGKVDFDPGPEVDTLTSKGASDIFVQKLDSDGNLLWAKSFGGTGRDRGLAIALDKSGNVYTTGCFYGTVDFNPGAGKFNRSSKGGQDVFVHKMDSAGRFIWVKTFGGGRDDEASCGIAIDASGNVHTLGNFTGRIDFDPGPGVTKLTSWIESDFFIQKLDSSGNFLWANSTGSYEYICGGLAIAVDLSGNVYTTGEFGGTTDFDPGPDTFNMTCTGVWDFFVQKLDSSGNFVWAKSVGNSHSWDLGQSIKVDSAGDIYIGGFFTDSVDFDPGPAEAILTWEVGSACFLLKLDVDGNYLWAKAVGHSSEYSPSVSLDPLGNIYIRDVFEINKLNSSGDSIWSVQSVLTSMASTVDGFGNIYTTGWFIGDGSIETDFDPGEGVYNLPNGGRSDIFIQKISQGSTRIKDVAESLKIAVYPNPTSGVTQIKLEKELANATLTLTDLNGKLLFTQQYARFSGTTIELPQVAGVYFLTISASDFRKTVKVVRQ